MGDTFSNLTMPRPRRSATSSPCPPSPSPPSSTSSAPNEKSKRKRSEVSDASDDKPSVAEVCDNFGLNDVDLKYTDADYQNLTWNRFQSTYKQRIQGANPKVPQPKLMMLVAAKWREFQASSPDIQEVTAAREGPSKKIVSTQHGMGPHSVLRSKVLLCITKHIFLYGTL